MKVPLFARLRESRPVLQKLLLPRQAQLGVRGEAHATHMSSGGSHLTQAGSLGVAQRLWPALERPPS